MTLLFMDGFQDPALLPKAEWSVGVAATTGRDGSTNGAVRHTSTVLPVCTLSSTAAICIAGTAHRNNSLADVPDSIFIYRDTAGTNQLFVMLTSGGLIEVRRGFSNGTILGTSSGHTPVAGASWHYFEVKANLHTSTGSVTIKLDGVTVLTLTGQQTSTTISNVAFVLRQAAASSNTDWDDWYICDAVDATATQARANNDFLGDIRIQTIYPTGVGDTTQMTPSSAVANWTTVDETPPVTTDYVSDNAVGDRDLYALGDLTGNITTVYAIRESIYVGKTDAGNALLKPVIKESGGTVTVDTAQAVALAAAGIHGSLKAARPSDSGSWTTTDVNALQAGQEVA